MSGQMDVDPPQVFHPSAFEVQPNGTDQIYLEQTLGDQQIKVVLDKDRSDLVANNILLPPPQRVYNTRSTDPLPTDNQSVDGELLLTGLSQLVRNATDQSTLDCITKNYGSVRQGIEITGAVTQCLNVIGGHRNQSCWICGVAIDMNVDLYKPECEHIFPIAQAIAFTGLFSSSLYKSLQDTQKTPYIEGLKLEYAWSHKICNRVKNATHFIKFGMQPNGLAAYAIDDKLISDFLNAIRINPSYENKPNPLYGRDLSSRVSVIRKRCERILRAAITDVGVDINTHVANTLNDLKTYIVNNFDCGISPPVPNTSRTIMGSSTLTEQTSQYAIQLRDYYFRQMIELYIPGFLNEIMTSLPGNMINYIAISGQRTSGSRIKSFFNKIFSEHNNKISQQYILELQSSPHTLYNPDFIKRLRYTLIIILIKNFPRDSEAQLWSKYQTWLIGIIYIFVLTQTQLYMETYTNSLRQVLFENRFIIHDDLWNHIIIQISQKFINYEARMNQNVISTIDATYQNQFVVYQTYPYEQFEAEIQAYQSKISEKTWFKPGGKRRRSKRSKTHRKVRIF